MSEKERLEKANEFLKVVASYGRKFFLRDGTVSHLELDSRGRIWFIDSYSKKRVYTHYRYDWKGFTNGGTLRRLVECLRDYVKKNNAFVLPGWHYWDYGDDISKVLEEGAKLGFVRGKY